MQNSKKNDPKKTALKMQEKSSQKAGSGTSVHPSLVAPHVNPSKTKSMAGSKQVSHKVEYRQDHPKTETGMKNPATPASK